jgi:hypothetical protein
MKKYHTFLLYTLKYFGINWLLFRLWYFIKIKFGIVRYQTRQSQWVQYSLENILSHTHILNTAHYIEYRSEHSPGFFFSHTDKVSYRRLLSGWDDRILKNNINDLENGYFRFFSYLKLYTGFPPDWHKNYTSNKRYFHNAHWSTINDFEGGDIKIVWEPSRFSFVYDLVRVYWRTSDEKYPELFWKSVEDWYDKNPPNNGPNWKCGQESTFRMMAWCWGLYGFSDSPSSTAERIEKLLKMIYFTGTRIERNIKYALSQKNNHGISEAAGLWTIGILFPEYKDSERWRQKGRDLIIRQTLELISEEGAFSQNSVNYQRVVLHVLLWACLLGDLNGASFDQNLKERLRKAAELLFQLQDEGTGRLPNYGANDGALILPLSDCDYRDYRPIIQSVFYYLDNKRIFEDGPWNEDLLWLFGADSLDAPTIVKSKYNIELKNAGYYTIRSHKGFIFTRCGKHRFRPGHADMLHTDIWWNGHNIAIDPGSYSYNAPPPWDKGLGGSQYHNTVTIDGLSQTDSYGKFLSFPWVQGEVLRNQLSDKINYKYFEGTHNGYHRLRDTVRYRRAIILVDSDYWIILDKVWSSEVHGYRLHWLLSEYKYKWDQKNNSLSLFPANNEYQIHYGVLNENSIESLVSADPSSPRGWWSPYYYHKEPSLSLEVITHATCTMFYTVFGPGIIDIQRGDTTLNIFAGDKDIFLHMNIFPNSNPLVVDVKGI